MVLLLITMLFQLLTNKLNFLIAKIRTNLKISLRQSTQELLALAQFSDQF